VTIVRHLRQPNGAYNYPCEVRERKDNAGRARDAGNWKMEKEGQ
jgi:hypothetical protein